MTHIRNIQFGEHQVKQITIIRRSSTDLVIFELYSYVPSPFPEMDKSEPGMYAPDFHMETRKGYAEEWLRLTFGVSPQDPKLVILGEKQKVVEQEAERTFSMHPHTTLIFIINGEEHRVTINLDSPLKHARNIALVVSKNMKHHDEWDVRTTPTGERLDVSRTIVALGLEPYARLMLTYMKSGEDVPRCF